MCPFNLTTLRTLNAVAAHRQGQRIAIISGDRRVHGHYVSTASTCRAGIQRVRTAPFHCTGGNSKCGAYHSGVGCLYGYTKAPTTAGLGGERNGKYTI